MSCHSQGDHKGERPILTSRDQVKLHCQPARTTPQPRRPHGRPPAAARSLSRAGTTIRSSPTPHPKSHHATHIPHSPNRHLAWLAKRPQGASGLALGIRLRLSGSQVTPSRSFQELDHEELRVGWQPQSAPHPRRALQWPFSGASRQEMPGPYMRHLYEHASALRLRDLNQACFHPRRIVTRHPRAAGELIRCDCVAAICHCASKQRSVMARQGMGWRRDPMRGHPMEKLAPGPNSP